MITAAFYIFSAFAIAALLAMLKSRNIVRAIVWFAVFLIIMAAFFALLKAPFLALGQLVIFTGGMIAVLLMGISFSGMEAAAPQITNHPSTQLRTGKTQIANYAGYKILALLFLLTLLISLKLFFANDTVEVPASQLALQLFGAYWPVIGIFMLMFLAALLSAVFFLKKDE
ncbi:MAG: NADH-quinone oxidoreductase subunit J [bacterium]|nr:NADH-quinone oxidoreductase subunit J [bacterium]